MKVSGKILLVMLILSGFCAPRCGATVHDSNGSEANVQALLNAAHDGDTITLPAGTFSWTSTLNITKGITLRGQTTITGAGTSSPVVNDVTIIKDDTPRTESSDILDVSITSTQSFRMTGIAFTHGASADSATSNGAFRFVGHDNSPVMNCRIDHCHFDSLYQAKLIFVAGWIYGVADHNVIELLQNTFPFYVAHATYGGTSQIAGNGAWADYPWFGTEKFFFIEDNTIIRTGSPAANSMADSDLGGRYVIRHNYVKNAIPANHGTEGGVGRGARAQEVYDNIFDLTVRSIGGGQRSGTSLWHDNTFIGIEPIDDTLCSLGNFREGPARPDPIWGIADGTSVWDKNDTEGNGTFVEGHPPYLFASGTVSVASARSGTAYVFTASGNPGWTVNQWAGYSIKNLNLTQAYGSYIISNTANTITYFRYNGTDNGGHYLDFAVGDSFQIHRVLDMMDQCGSGKGDQLTGSPNPINTVTGVASYNHQTVEPCYSWNSVYTPNGHALGYANPDYPTTKLGVDYFNLGAGFPPDSTPTDVLLRYTTELNGVDYVGPFVYPHPLVTGVPRAVVADFNGDGKPDFVLERAVTQETAIWYLDNNVLIGGDFGPTLPPHWTLAASADFDRDGHADWALFHPDTGYTAIWYMSGPTPVSGAWGPSLPNGWELVGAADINRDGHPDYVLYNASAHQTAIWYLINHLLIGGDFGPALPNGWRLVGVADFDRDGHPDYLLFYPYTGDTAIWYLSGSTLIGGEFGPTIPSGWILVATADFDGDGYPDFLLYNGSETAIWYLNNNVFVSSASGPSLPAAWRWVEP
jgi:VCBS repeat protein